MNSVEHNIVNSRGKSSKPRLNSPARSVTNKSAHHSLILTTTPHGRRNSVWPFNPGARAAPVKGITLAPKMVSVDNLRTYENAGREKTPLGEMG
jgi:hypothetical protein